MTLARRILGGDLSALTTLVALPLAPSALVPRPWGGQRLAALKGLPAAAGPVGESFELSACPADPEAAAYPSVARLPDGSSLPLPALLSALGLPEGVPLLPKLLDVAALLSIQLHPPGNPEAYVVLAADPGATLRLGLRAPADPAVLRAEVARGLTLQAELCAALRPDVPEAALQPRLGPWLTAQNADPAPDLTDLLRPGFDPSPVLAALRALCRAFLDRLHTVALEPGMVIFNRRLSAGPASADLHALGDPAGRAALLLELRRPGPTWRVWDHARFPRRPLDPDLALADLPAPVPAGFFEVLPRPIPGRPGAACSVDCEAFRVEHLHPDPEVALARADAVSSLHGVLGHSVLLDAAGTALLTLGPGDSALLLPGRGPLRLAAVEGSPRVVHLLLPGARPHVAGPQADEPAPPLRFGTSGLRGLVRHMTDREVFLATAGFLDHLRTHGEIRAGDPVALGEDLRARCAATGTESSPRIARAVAAACRALAHPPVHCGRLPTPALAHWAGLPAAGKRPMAAVMVTGSHIPADRNGVKFYRPGGEVLKDDEAGILAAIAARRARPDARFDARGAFLSPPLPAPDGPAAARAYVARYVDAFGPAAPLAGLRLAFYQHSAVGRDLCAEVLAALGAEILPCGRTDDFVPLDTEDLAPADLARLGDLARVHGADALLSTDGDSDRPLLLDERGAFCRGDVLGLVAALHLGATFAAVPVSTTDAVDLHLCALARQGRPVMALEKTRIGSPWVIAAMRRAVARGECAVVGWEANGGFLLGSDLPCPGGVLRALPTRDALLPLIAVLAAARARKVPVSALFAELPARATASALLDGVEPEQSAALLADPAALAAALAALPGLGEVVALDLTDGARIRFACGDIVHVRPSGNAPQLRAYVVADDPARASALLEAVLLAPDSLLRRRLGG